jgi:sugar-specific transcriptional regulator TrmB
VSGVRERATAELRALGLSALEAAIYLHLLRAPGSTGYRVARDLGKPAANVYGALESLRGKGAIVLEQGAGRTWRALSGPGLERELAERLREHTGRLTDALAKWEGDRPGTGTWQLAAPEQVYAQAQAMLAGAKTIAIADLFPGPLAKLRPALEKAAARRVTVAVQAYEATALRDAEVVVSHRGREILGRWPGQWLQLVVDGAESLVALLSEGGDAVVHSTWTTRPHLAWTSHSALSGDLIATRLVAALEAGETAKQVKALARRLQSRLRAPDAPGYRRLVAGVAKPATARRVRRSAPAR